MVDKVGLHFYDPQPKQHSMEDTLILPDIRSFMCRNLLWFFRVHYSEKDKKITLSKTLREKIKEEKALGTYEYIDLIDFCDLKAEMLDHPPCSLELSSVTSNE